MVHLDKNHLNKNMVADVRRVNELCDELHAELVKQGLWESFTHANYFARADYTNSLEKKIQELTKANNAFRMLGYYRDQAVKRFKKLDVIHNCQCEECTKQRTKFNTLLDSISVHDNENNIEEMKKLCL